MKEIKEKLNVLIDTCQAKSDALDEKTNQLTNDQLECNKKLKEAKDLIILYKTKHSEVDAKKARLLRHDELDAKLQGINDRESELQNKIEAFDKEKADFDKYKIDATASIDIWNEKLKHAQADHDRKTNQEKNA